MSFRSQQSFRLLVRDPSLGHAKPSCLGFLAKLFIPFSIFDKSLHSFCLPTYIHPATHLLPPTHRPTSTHLSTHLLSTYLRTSTHTSTRQSTSTHLHPPNYYLPTYLPPSKYPSTYLPLSTQLQPLTHLQTYLTINKPNPLFSTHVSTYLPTYHLPPTYINTYLYQPIFISTYSPTYLLTNIST